MMLEAARGDVDDAPVPHVGAFAGVCDAAMREAADALRHARASQGEFRLLSGQRTLMASLAENADAFAVTLRDASDRIVDAIDSLLHVLAQPRDTAPPGSR